ncbi:PR domain zinc finger protein 2 [Hippocampus comes]|uniref:PR domain zinc finger protein 2 n=1 Tax=Hippocampus comes TaxID=109280 RepID=UPI00094E8A51|nr:PREDICTED: PR domain zinc finger protein 2-like [Hippocampus comes]XP_019743478.1 PREDICTED: PR domain zinc finger protein 2-like [Hippocampus comes]
MEPNPHFSEYGDVEDVQQEDDDIGQESTSMEPDTCDVHDHPAHATRCGWESFPCEHCGSCFTSRQDLEGHMHSHALIQNVTHTYKSKRGEMASSLDFDPLQHDNVEPSVSVSSDAQMESTNTPGHNSVLPDEHLYEHYACSYCEKRFTTYPNKEQHESTVHEQHLQIARAQQSETPYEGNQQQIIIATSNHRAQLAGEMVDDEVERAGNYMLDVSSSISENLRFYFDGKIVSTSTVSSCEAAEVHAACSTLVGLDALILDPTHLNLGLSMDSILSNQESPGQALARRRTATPPLLPQIQTELESEVVVSSSSSEPVTSFMENPLAQMTESSLPPPNPTIVYLSPKVSQLQENQDILLPDGQTVCSSVSAAARRFKRRTVSPQSSPQHSTTSDEEAATTDTDVDAVSLRHTDTQSASERGNTSQNIEEAQAIPLSTESWPPATVDNRCSQQPLDLSSTMKRNDVGDSDDAALDLSLQKRSLEEARLISNFVFPSGDHLNACLQQRAFLSVGEQNGSAATHETPLVSDLAIVTGSNMADSVAEGLVYGLSLPSCPLNSAPATLTPLELPLATPCAVSFAPSATHPALPAAPSLITVLAPPLSLPSPSSQPIQVLAPNISPEPLVLCAENAINPTQCDLTSAFAATNAANLVALSHPLDPSLNLPGHMFLADQISLSPPLNGDHGISEVPFTSAAALNDPLINSYNITSNTVLIECTISLETPGNVPAAVPARDCTEPAVSAQMLVNHIEQQQMVSLPNTATVDPAVLISSIEKSVRLSSSTSLVPDFPAKAEEPDQDLAEEPPNADEEEPAVFPAMAEEPDQDLAEEPPNADEEELAVFSAKAEEPDQDLAEEPPNADEEEPADGTESAAEVATDITESVAEVATDGTESGVVVSADDSKRVENVDETEPPSNTASDAEPQTFAKNFICNVCNLLFHSMKELGHHVSDHAEEWPYKCEFCVLLFEKPSALLDHRSSLHGVDKTYLCSACPKDFVYFCNLKQHQEELHPAQQCTFTEEEKGKVRSQNYNYSAKVSAEPALPDASADRVKKEENEVDVAAEELFTTIKILASDGGKLKAPDVRLGINQHYPSFKPPPFPYHNRSPAGSPASATNFTTHNIPQTFSTAIRCTKCGKSFDNMPELHKHILACANASDKRRYTPKKNPIPLRHFAKSQNGVLSTTNSENESNASNGGNQSNESSVKIKLKLMNKRKRKLAQRVMPKRSKSLPNKASPPRAHEDVFVCPHCSREFTMRRSRTKHMAVCPQKPREVRTRKEGGISVTKENDGRLHRGVSHMNEQRASAHPQTRLQTSRPAKRPAPPPAPTSFLNKRPKLATKEDSKNDISTLNDLPAVRPFNPPLRQYTRVHHGVKLPPAKQQQPSEPPTPIREEAGGSSGQSATA